MAVDNNSNTIYIAARASNDPNSVGNVVVIDGKTNKTVAKIDVGKNPFGVAINL